MVTVTMKKKKDRKLKAQDDCNYAFKFCIQKRLEGNILKYSILEGQEVGTVGISFIHSCTSLIG